MRNSVIQWSLVLLTTALSSCFLEEGTSSGTTAQACKDTPAVCDGKCLAPPILIELHDEKTTLEVPGATVSGPLTRDGGAFEDAAFVGVCKSTTDKTKTLCTINERKNYVGVAVSGKFTFKITAPGYKTATVTANVPVRTDDCCFPFVPATDSFSLPPK